MAKKAVDTVETVVEAAVVEETPVKKTTKKATTKKAAAKAEEDAEKKPAARKRKPTTEVFVEFGGVQVSASEIIEKAQEAFAAANEGVAVKTISIYVKPEENAAYYVVNGEGSEDYKVEL